MLLLDTRATPLSRMLSPRFSVRVVAAYFACLRVSVLADLLLSEFAVSTGNRPQPCKLEVWEWVVKCRIFDPFSKISGLFSFMPEFSMNLHIYTTLSGWAGVTVSPFPCYGVMV